MWRRKTIKEIAIERAERQKEARYIYYPIQTLVIWYIIDLLRETGEFPNVLFTHPDQLTLWLFPLLLYVGYKGYINTGSLGGYGARAMMCLHCEKGMGYGDDGWGFKVFGKKKTKWYQVKGCSTPENCDIAYVSMVKHILDNRAPKEQDDSS